MSESSVQHHQREGVAWDIIAEALETHRQWLLDDDYDAMGCLQKIMHRMRERRALYRPPPPKE